MRGFANPLDWPARFPVRQADSPVDLALPDAPNLGAMGKVTTTCLIKHSKIGELRVKVFLGMPGSPQFQRLEQLTQQDVATSYCFAGVLGLPIDAAPGRLPGMFVGLRVGLCVPMRFNPRADAFMLIEVDDALFYKCGVAIHPLTQAFVEQAQKQKHANINSAKILNKDVK